MGQLDQLVARGTHFVRWGSVDAHPIGVTIGCDNIAGGRMAGAHLIARGATRIGFIGDADDHYPEFRDRYRGLCAALREAGLPVHPGLHADALSVEQSGYDATKRLLARDLPFDALFAASDLIALGAVRALTEAGRRVPEDVAIIGFDDIPDRAGLSQGGRGAGRHAATPDRGPADRYGVVAATVDRAGVGLKIDNMNTLGETIRGYRFRFGDDRG